MRGFGWYDEWAHATGWRIALASLIFTLVVIGLYFVVFILFSSLNDLQENLLGGAVIGLLIGIPIGIGIGRRRERKEATSDG